MVCSIPGQIYWQNLLCEIIFDECEEGVFDICGSASDRTFYCMPLLICPCIIERSHASHSSENMTETDITSQNQLGFELQQDEKKPQKSSKLGKVILGITGAAAVGLVLVTTPFLTPALRKICLPYVPATERQVANIMRMAQASKRQGSTLVDLGSGDGRVVCII